MLFITQVKFIFVFITGLLTPIIQCLKEQQHNLKLYALSALNEIAKYNEDLAQTIVNVKCLPIVINFLIPSFTDIKVQVHNIMKIYTY